MKNKHNIVVTGGVGPHTVAKLIEIIELNFEVIINRCSFQFKNGDLEGIAQIKGMRATFV